MKSAGKARNNGLYRHIRTSKEIIRNLLNDWYNIYAVYQSWNDISSAVSIDGFTYYADGTNQNKDIQIVGAALTGTTLANTSIYSKNILGVYTQQGFWSYTGKVSKAAYYLLLVIIPTMINTWISQMNIENMEICLF